MNFSVKILTFIALFSLLFSCSQNKTQEIKKSLRDPSVLEIQDLFDSHKYTKVIRAVDEFYKSTNTKKSATPLYFKALTLEKIAGILNTTNRSASRTYAGYKKYFLRRNHLYIYNGEDYKRLFYDYPRSAFAEDAYKRYLELNNPFDSPSVHSVKNYIVLLKELLNNSSLEKSEINNLNKDLFKAYRFLSGLESVNKIRRPVNKSYFKQLEHFSDKIIKTSHNMNLLLTAYKSKLAIALFRNKKKEGIELSKKIIKIFPDNKIAIIPHYLLGNYFYTENQLSSSLKHYKQALKLLSRHSLSEEDLGLFNISKENIKHFKQEIYKKIKVIAAELAYNQAAQNHRIGMITGDVVRLRSSQDTKSSRNVIAALNTGDKVVILKQSKNKTEMENYTDYWYYVRIRNGQDGWIFGKYLLIF